MKKDPEFKKQLSEMVRDMCNRTANRISYVAAPMVGILSSIATSDNVPPSIRVSAANSILSHWENISAILDIDERILALEESERIRKMTQNDTFSSDFSELEEWKGEEQKERGWDS